MTKQEEIREGIAKIICCLSPQECDRCNRCPDEWEDVAEQVDEVLSYLHSQGLVIKRDCKHCEGTGSASFFINGEATICPFCHGGKTVESLIKEELI